MSASERLDQIERTAHCVTPTDVGVWKSALRNSAADGMVIAPADLVWLLAVARNTRGDLMAETERPHVVSVVYDVHGRALHTCLECHFAGFSAPPLPCPGRPATTAGNGATAQEEDQHG